VNESDGKIDFPSVLESQTKSNYNRLIKSKKVKVKNPQRYEEVFYYEM